MIRRHMHLPASPDRVWDDLTDPDALAHWFGGRFDWQVEEGARFGYLDPDGSAWSGRVDVVRPGRYLRFQWEDEEGRASEVSYLLEPAADGGTDLTIQERQIAAPAPAPAASAEPAAASAAMAGSGACGRWTARDSALLRAWAAPVAVA